MLGLVTPTASTRVEPVLRFLLAIMLVGAARSAQLHGSPVSSVLWHDFGWAESAFTTVDAVAAWVLYATAAIVILARGRVLAWAILPALVWLVLVPLAKLRAGGDFGYLLAPFTKGNRPLGLLALVMLAHAPARARDLLRLGVVFVFAAHGLEAVFQHPQFIDYLIVTSDQVTSFRPSEGLARVVVVGIGAVDIAVAAALVRGPRRAVLVWACIWGFTTALMRLVYFGPVGGAHHAAIRSLNGGGALVLLLSLTDGVARTARAPTEVSDAQLVRS